MSADIYLRIPFASLFSGVKYINDCPKEPRLPIYLLVGGAFGTLKLLSTLWRNMRSRRHHDLEIIYDDQDSDGAFATNTYKTMDTVLLLFLTGWLVTGTYWMLSIWKPHFQQLLHEPSNWCDKTVYMFCVYQIFGCYGIMGIYIFILLLLSFCYRCLTCCWYPERKSSTWKGWNKTEVENVTGNRWAVKIWVGFSFLFESLKSSNLPIGMQF